MTHSENHGRRSTAKPLEPVDRRNAGEEYLTREIEENRRAEFWLIPKALFALAIVAVLVVIRQVFFV